MNARNWIAWGCTIGFLAGCSGNASLPHTSAGLGGYPVSPSFQRAVLSNVAEGSAAPATLVVKIVVPAAAVRAHYVSPSTKGLRLNLRGPSKVKEAVGLTPSSPGCKASAGATTCKLTVRLLSGHYRGTVATYDQAAIGGTIPAGANLLSIARNFPFTIAPRVTNRIGFSLSGVVASLTVSGLPNASLGTAFSSPQGFTVTAQDADGNAIVGSFKNAVTLADSDASGATSIATTGSDHPPAGKLVSSSDVATLSYSGATLVSATISASASGAKGGSASFSPSPVLTSISAQSGLIGTSVSETLTGNFIPNATNVIISGSQVTPTITNSTATSITANFFIDPEAATTVRNVTVSVGSGATSTAQSFSVGNTNVRVVTTTADFYGGGSLRLQMGVARPGTTIVFDTTLMCGGKIPCKITLGSQLPAIPRNETIDGGQLGRVIVDAGGNGRAFWVDTGNVTIANLEIQNGYALGGAGGMGPSSQGGGGAGLGGAIFVNQAAANVTVANDYFLNSQVTGGIGGSGGGAPFDGAGGGGLGGSGGSPYALEAATGGGGAIVSASSPASPCTASGAGADGGGGGAGGDTGCTTAGAGGAGFLGNVAGLAGTNSNGTDGGNGGAGGFGGGGGGGGQGNPGGNGGAGGLFGGGGGGGATYGGTYGSGGNGGAGGGGGGAFSPASGGSGGALEGYLRGGNGDGQGNGGGGAAAGPVIFVNAGTLTTIDSTYRGSTAIGGFPGQGYFGGSATAGSADATPVFNYAGTVNGSATAGPVPGALTSQLRQRHGHPIRVIRLKE